MARANRYVEVLLNETVAFKCRRCGLLVPPERQPQHDTWHDDTRSGAPATPVTAYEEGTQ